jgi:Ca2+-binding EF-hand superfamily protein
MGACNGSLTKQSKHEWMVNKAQFTSLGLHKQEVARLYGIFSRIDVDDSGQISLLELLDYLQQAIS